MSHLQLRGESQGNRRGKQKSGLTQPQEGCEETQNGEKGSGHWCRGSTMRCRPSLRLGAWQSGAH